MRHSLLIAASLLAGSFIIGLTSEGQVAPAAAPPGRYQIAVDNKDLPTVILCDTTTGQCWSHVVGGNRGWRPVTDSLTK
jgi:hypothetical protein